MGIKEIVSKGNIARKATEKFEIARPINNFFLGDFSVQEKKKIIEMIKDRVGATRRIHFCEFTLEDEDEYACEEHIGIEATRYALYDSFQSNGTVETGRYLNDEFENAINAYITEIFNESSSERYSANGQVRVNLIIDSDSVVSSFVTEISTVIRNALIGLYPNGVYVDIYCLFNQRVISKEQNGEAIMAFRYYLLSELNKLADASNVLIYILSNYTSRKVLIDDRNENDSDIPERFRCMILNMFIKDGRSIQKEGAPIFVEKEFIESTRLGDGRFYSLGDCKLELDFNSRDYSVIQAVLDDIANESSDIHAENIAYSIGLTIEDVDRRIKAISREFGWVDIDNEVWTIIREKADNIQGKFLSDTCKKLINDLYEDRLDLFWEKNSEYSEKDLRHEAEEYAEDIIHRVVQRFMSGDISFPEMIAVFQFYIAGAKECRKQNAAEFESSQKVLAVFYDKKITPDDKKDSLYNEPLIIKRLVCDYFDVRRKIDFHKKMRICYDVICQTLEEYASEKQEILNCFETASTELAVMIDENINENEANNLEILSGNIQYYYTLTKEYIASGSEIYHEWKKLFFNRIVDGAVNCDDLLESVYMFCQNTILVMTQYNLPFSEEILKRLHNYKNRYDTEDSIHELAYDTFLQQRNYYAYQSTFGVVIDVICFLVNPDNRFFDSTNERVKGNMDNRQMKVFLEKNYLGMDILYLEGRFAWNSIYQFEIYQSAYEKMKTRD